MKAMSDKRREAADMKAIKVMLVDDHAIVRAGYRFLLDNDPEISVAAEAANGEDALRLAEEVGADVIVLDLSMPGQGGMETLRRLLHKQPGAKVLIFTMHENPAFVEQALQVGARGYISKNSEPDVLVAALRRVARGGIYVDAELAQRMVVQQTRRQDSPFAGLSQREFQILCRFAEAVSIPDIARELSISTKTVANYLGQIKEKLRVGSTAELVRLALAEGLVSL